jgi:hypothetical protein
MTISQVSSSQGMNYQPNYSASQEKIEQSLLSTTVKNDVVTSDPENSPNLLLAEQIDNIKSNYETAKDMDLTRMYYEQQQKVIEAYMYSNGSETSNTNNESDKTSITKSLNELYTSLYEIHNTVKNGAQQLPSYSENNVVPIVQPEVINDQISQAQTEKYNSIMMPSNTSQLHLSA